MTPHEKYQVCRFLKNCAKYSIGLPFMLAATVLLAPFAIVIASVTGDWDPLRDTTRALWTPVE